MEFLFCQEKGCVYGEMFFWGSLGCSLLLGLIESIRFFGYISTLVQFFIFSCLSLITFYSVQQMRLATSLDLLFQTVTFNPGNLLQGISLALFTVEGIFLMFPIRSNMVKSNLKIDFYLLYSATLAFVDSIYISFGLLNYLGLGNRVRDFIFYNYTEKNPILLAMESLYIIFLLLGSNMSLFPVFNVVYSSKIYKGLISQRVR